jgi:hypothetical protein
MAVISLYKLWFTGLSQHQAVFLPETWPLSRRRSESDNDIENDTNFCPPSSFASCAQRSNRLISERMDGPLHRGSHPHHVLGHNFLLEVEGECRPGKSLQGGIYFIAICKKKVKNVPYVHGLSLG